jgi:hypothetical protein
MQVVPYRTVRGIPFDMRRTEVHGFLGRKPVPFRRSTTSTEGDLLESDGTYFYYDSDERLAAVEFFGPVRPIASDVDVLGERFSLALSAMRLVDANIKFESDGAISFKLGLAVYAPTAAKAPTVARVESVLAFRRGYYD